MPQCAHAQARYTVVCLCVDCYNCSVINEVQELHRLLAFLDCNSCIFKLNLRSQFRVSFAYFEGHCSLFRLVRSNIS